MKRTSKRISRVAAVFWGLQIFVGPACGSDDSAEQSAKPLDWRIKGCSAAVADRDKAVAGAALTEGLCNEVWRFIGQNNAQSIAERLKDEDSNVRGAAIEALGELGAKEQLPAIAERLKDDDPWVRRKAVRILGELATKEQVPTIAKWLKDENGNVRWAAVEALGKLGAKEQAADIAERIKDEDSNVRGAAIESLGELDAKEQAPAIVKWLKDEDDKVRQAVVEALGKLGAKDQAPIIAERLKDKDSNVREAVVLTLGILGVKEQARPITERLKDEDEEVRQAAVEALSELGAKDQAPTIVEWLKDKDPSMRWTAVTALGKLGAKEQIRPITERLKDENVNVRWAAIEALGELGAKEQAPAIAERLKDKNSEVRKAAVLTLRNLGAKEQAPAIVERLRDENDKVRQAAALALGKLDAKEQLPVISEWLKDEDETVREAAIEALGKLGAKEQAPVIVERLKDVGFGVRYAAVRALGELGAKEQTPAITAWIRDKDSNVRLAAVEALGKLGAKDQAPIIAERLKDNDSNVREAAIEALGELGAKEQAPAIAERLKDEDSSVRGKAIEALLNIGVTNDTATLVNILEIPLYESSRHAQLTALTHVLAGGAEKVETALLWLIDPPSGQEKPDSATVNQVLSAYIFFWDNTLTKAQKLRKEMSGNVARIVVQTGPIGLNVESLIKVRDLLQDGYPDNAETLSQTLASREKIKAWLSASEGFAVHLVFWALLILAYPRYRSVQAIFFWNPWVRKIVGLWYVGFLLTWSPRLRRRLLSPFREALLADARLDVFDEATYFPDRLVKTPVQQLRPLLKELETLRGQVLLEGDSGLGKTSFIRQHLKQSQRLAVFLPAQRCGKGVLPAIQGKLKGYAEDEGFLKSLIYSGALDVYIDGLNEAPPEIRAHINQFADDFFRANLLLSSQPMKWEPPTSVRVLELQALDEPRIEAFLSSRPLPKDACMVQEEFEQRVRDFLARHFSKTKNEDVVQRTRTVLSNPLDLSVVAEMLAQRETPDVFNLQQQFFDVMARDYAEENSGQAFPLKNFAEDVYAVRKQNEWMSKLRETWATELDYLVKHRLMIRRDLEAGSAADKQIVTRWYFRHDKIQDFFLSEAFFDSRERQNDHMGDARFRGVYFYLARQLPLEQALNLRDRLTEYAADHSDHTVSDAYIQILRTRPDWVSPAV